MAVAWLSRNWVIPAPGRADQQRSHGAGQSASPDQAGEHVAFLQALVEPLDVVVDDQGRVMHVPRVQRPARLDRAVISR